MYKELKNVIATGDPVVIKAFMQQNGLVLEGNKIKPTTETAKKLEEQQKFWNQRQLARKILLG